MPTVPTITPGSITGITGLPERPVFFIQLNGSLQTDLVVKGEAAGAALRMPSPDAVVSIAWGSKLMKNVQSKEVNVKIITQDEMQVFKNAALRFVAKGTNQYDNIFAKDRQYNWVKMPYVRNLDTAQILEESEWMGDHGFIVRGPRATPDLIKKALSLFSSDNAWYDLGKVLAVDIFLGNQDRFLFKTGFWQNYGNVMFQNGIAPTVIGLDFFDPNSGPKGNLSPRIDPAKRNETYEALAMLIDPIRRGKWAEKCTLSVGKVLGREAKGMSPFTLKAVGSGGSTERLVLPEEMAELFVGYSHVLDRGLEAGARELKNYLQNKVRQYGVISPIAFPGIAPPAVPPPPMAVPARNRLAVGSQRVAVAPAAVPARPAAAAPQKMIPEGILDRMRFLNWL